MKCPERNEIYERLLGRDSSFHNPYTFIPFPPEEPGVLDRQPSTPLTIDEDPNERDRFTGVIELEVVTQTPLLTCEADPINPNPKDGHKRYRALTIGRDVIVPATGVRAALEPC